MSENENMVFSKTHTEELIMFIFKVLNFTALLLHRNAWKFLLLDAFLRSQY